MSWAAATASRAIIPLLAPEIAYRGEPIALVVADTLETAIHAASLVRATYEEAPFAVTLDAPGVEIIDQAGTPLAHFIPPVSVGDADAAFAAAPVKIDACFSSVPQHQNPIELLSTVAEWRDSRLVIHEGRRTPRPCGTAWRPPSISPPTSSTSISPFVGGGFGQKNSMQGPTVLAAEARAGSAGR